MVAIWLPFADAFAAGLWLFWITEDEVIAVPRPSIHIVGEQIHNPAGPAVHWPTGERFYFWRGLQVQEDVILHPEKITIERITKEQNAEVRRVLIDRFGAEKYLRAIGAEMLHEDRFGKLYRAARRGDDPIVMVEVINKSAEPDGSFKKYMLRVRLSEWHQRRLNQHVKPEIQALAKRGRVTLAEVLELRCNSWEWEHLVPAMTDEAFVHTITHAFDNCARAPSPCSSYDESVTSLLGPEMLRRFRDLRDASVRLAVALMPENYRGAIQGEGAGEVASAHHSLTVTLGEIPEVGR